MTRNEQVVMVVLLYVIRAEHEENYRVRLTFNDGSEGGVDKAYFRRFFLDGGTVAWSNGADLAPETLYDAARAARSDKRMEPTRR